MDSMISLMFFYLLFFQWKSTSFRTSMGSSLSTIFYFCYTSLLIFKIVMLIIESLNISKDQCQKASCGLAAG